MFEAVFTIVILLGVMIGIFYIPRALYCMVCLPGNHPSNVAFRKAQWRRAHPNAIKTPWDN